MKRFSKLLAVIMSVTMLVTAFAIYPAKIAEVKAASADKLVWALDPATFATKITDGPFTLGYVKHASGSDQPAWGTLDTGTLDTVKMNATNDKILTENDEVLFETVDGKMHMTISNQAYTTVIRFTAPEAGTYTLYANITKNSGYTAQAGLYANWAWTNSMITSNGTENEYTKTVSLSKGGVYVLYIRGWAN